YFAHRINGSVTRWRLPGIGGFNFLLRQALGGGGMASLKADPLAKAFAQMLLDMPVRGPAAKAKKPAARIASGGEAGHPAAAAEDHDQQYRQERVGDLQEQKRVEVEPAADEGHQRSHQDRVHDYAGEQRRQHGAQPKVIARDRGGEGEQRQRQEESD